ncbi:MAG: deoxyribodipyrimidine photo-lyase [Actinomycetota bacterium]|nr:deoxyribodipyrimidine photo-lyase [Actinomycetota bacterium]
MFFIGFLKTIILSIIVSDYINFVEGSDINYPRYRELKKGKTGSGAIVYWMSRDQRSDDNWALLFAQDRAKELNRPLITFFYLSDQFLNADKSHFWFMLEGLKMVEKSLSRKNIPFLSGTGQT